MATADVDAAVVVEVEEEGRGEEEEGANPVEGEFTRVCRGCNAPLKASWERCPICKDDRTAPLTGVVRFSKRALNQP